MSLDTLCTDILWNFEILSSLEPNQTLLVSGDRLSFDTRRFQSLRRALTDDSRTQIVTTINKTLTLLGEMLTSYQYSVYLQPPVGGYVGHGSASQERFDTTERMYDNLETIVSKYEGVVKGLNVVKTFERYTKDVGFLIDIERIKVDLGKLIAKCSALIEKKTDAHRY